MKFAKGSAVEWRWIGRTIRGVVVQSFLKPVVREIKGKKIKRNGSPQNPAYLVRSESGNEALKLETELSSLTPVKKNQPKIFS